MLGDNLYLENIEEFVQDENKIVTYKWLSRKLDVSVNAAKRMLYAYAVHCKDSNPVDVMYFVSGIVGSDTNKHHEVCLVSESSLEGTKQKFSQLFSVHVYSVQKAHLTDSGVLFAADHDVIKEHLGDYSKWNTIDYTMSAKPSLKKPPVGSEAMQVATSRLPVLFHHIKQEKDEDVTSAGGKVVRTDDSGRVDNQQSLTKKVASKGKSKVQLRKGTVTSLFAKQAKEDSGAKKAPEQPKIKVEPSSTSPDSTAKTTVVHVESPKKSPHKSPGKRGRPPKSKETSSKKLTGMFQGLGDSDIEDSESDGEPCKNKGVVPNKRKQKKKVAESADCSNAAPQQGTRHQKGDNLHRKRKRVQELSSDEDEPEGDVVQTNKPDINSGGNKAKRRKRYKKMVSKMYMNEEGEMVTERVWEVVSTDASENEEEDVKPAELNSKTEKPSPAKQTKQSSLRSFFKK